MSVTLKSVVLHNEFENGLPPAIDLISNRNLPLAAVVVSNAVKSFGHKGSPVIQNLNMTIPQGTIYSLLGSSGCGKSTTLSCIIGITKFTNGEVYIFGEKGGTRASKEMGIPGSLVGYMPQEYSLYEELSIQETFQFYGTLYGMSWKGITSAVNFHINLLQIPEKSRRVQSLSGGQKRRLSFAVAVMHNPPLIFLDEPTVGVDPLLQRGIWEHLQYLSKENGSTVVITTHYVEEARLSDTVGLMRNGRLIEEKPLQSLLHDHGTASLEAIVLNICRREENKGEDTSDNSSLEVPLMAGGPTKASSNTGKCSSRMSALIQKNVWMIVRNLTVLLMTVIIPAVGIFVTIIADGNNPQHVRLGVVNDELENDMTCNDVTNLYNGACQTDYFGCAFLNQLPSPQIIQVTYETVQEAEIAVREGVSWGFIYIPYDYTSKLYERTVNGTFSQNSFNFTTTTSSSSEISDMIVRLDETNTIVAQHFKYSLLQAFQTFYQRLLHDCGYSSAGPLYSLNYKEPVLGIKAPDVRQFIIPSIFVAFLTFGSIVPSGIRYVSEKRSGNLERSLVAGVRPWEILVAFCVPEFFLIILRIFTVYVMVVWVFQMETRGSLLLVLSLAIIVSYMGVGQGFLLGVVFAEEIQVALVILTLFIPNMLVSGMLWPLEGMPYGMQQVSYFLPSTLASEGMRSIVNRGWSIEHPNVWQGFVSSGIYALIFFTLSIFIASRRLIK